MLKCKLVLDESVLSTLHRGREGQNVYRMIFSNPCDQGCRWLWFQPRYDPWFNHNLRGARPCESPFNWRKYRAQFTGKQNLCQNFVCRELKHTGQGPVTSVLITTVNWNKFPALQCRSLRIQHLSTLPFVRPISKNHVIRKTWPCSTAWRPRVLKWIGAWRKTSCQPGTSLFRQFRRS